MAVNIFGCGNHDFYDIVQDLVWVQMGSCRPEAYDMNEYTP